MDDANAAIPDHHRDCVGVVGADGVADLVVSKSRDNRRQKWSIPIGRRDSRG
jgi:hypothetical protein